MRAFCQICFSGLREVTLSPIFRRVTGIVIDVCQSRVRIRQKVRAVLGALDIEMKTENSTGLIGSDLLATSIPAILGTDVWEYYCLGRYLYNGHLCALQYEVNIISTVSFRNEMRSGK